MASGPIMPWSLAWYLLSNYLCATASYHCTTLPLPFKIWAALGLTAGGEGHVRETVQYFMGEHKPFMHHLDMYGDSPPRTVQLFGINAVASSLLGIYYFMYEWITRNQRASNSTKVAVSTIVLLTTLYELHWQRNVKVSSLEWHYLHMMVTHLGLSMMPPMIVWYYYPNINLFALPWTVKYPSFSHQMELK